MDNFFDIKKSTVSTSLSNQYDNLKENYREIFIESAESIRKEIEKIKPENPCTLCKISNCKIESKDIFSDYPVGCAYKDWQSKVITFLSGDYMQKLKNIYKTLIESKNDYNCNHCGDCCRLAVSEYSYEQLKQRGIRGDKFSADFISVFVPYASEDDAKKANPEYFQLLNELVENQKAYYYYCPKLAGNECSDYENRPDICKEFPHNPLKLLPSKCSYNEWRNVIAHQAMLLKAKTDITEFYKNKLG